MIRISVPATSANIGSGFDSIGIALTLSNTVRMELCDGLDISASDKSVPVDENNLIYKCVKHVFELCGRPLPGLRVTQECRIPMTRGLGSSSAATVAGLLGGNALLGNPLSRQALINLAAVMEGHPDNSTPAILGGFVAALIENGQVWHVRFPIADGLYFAVFVPDFELETERARAILPGVIPRSDAIYNLSRSALLAGSLMAGLLHNIEVAVGDRLHQPYRFPLIPDGENIMRLAARQGARGAYISGAGPSIIAITDNSGFAEQTAPVLAEKYPRWTLQTLECDRVGAVIEEESSEL